MSALNARPLDGAPFEFTGTCLSCGQLVSDGRDVHRSCEDEWYAARAAVVKSHRETFGTYPTPEFLRNATRAYLADKAVRS